MSEQTDKNRRRIPGATELEVSLNGEQDTRRVPNADEVDKPKRRRMSINPSMETEDPNLRFVPAGHTTRWVDLRGDRAQNLYNEDWDFVLDNEGNKIIRDASSHGNSHKQVFMMKSTEFYEADAKKLAALRDEKLRRKAEPDDPRIKRDPFFHDVGMAQHRSGILDDKN